MTSGTSQNDFTARARLFGGNRMKLGVMAFNCSLGSTITTVASADGGQDGGHHRPRDRRPVRASPRTTATEINHVSYRGTAPAITAVVAGEVELMFTGPPAARSMSEGGKLKLLAVAAPQRIPLMPDVPTVQEADLIAATGIKIPQ